MFDLFGFEIKEPPEQLSLPLTFRARLSCAPDLCLEVWNSLGGIKMGQVTETIQVGQRWATALKKRFPERCRAKYIAKAFSVEVKTAETWLAGGAPQAKHFCTAWRLFGAPVIAEVIAPDSDFSHWAQADAAVAEIEQKIALINEKLIFLRRSGGGS